MMNSEQTSVDQVSRRLFLKKSAVVVGVAATIVPTMVSAANGGATPPQTEGPFYPVRDQLDKDADMTVVKGNVESARGTVIHISGVIRDAISGAAIPNAMIEFWQACSTGRYNHPDDTNPAELDPNFQYWAQVLTDDLGRYSLKTIKPGAYPADSSWTRPPHIHIKIHAARYPSLTTQVYFANEPLNDSDKILQRLSPHDQKKVIMDLSDVTTDDGKTKLVAQWDAGIIKKAARSLAIGLNGGDLLTPEIN